MRNDSLAYITFLVLDAAMTSTPTRPPMPRVPRSALRGLERLAVPTVDAINTQPTFKRITRPMWRYVGKTFVTALSANLYRLHGTETLRAIDAPQGIIIVPNHRSFFDLFFATAAMIDVVPHLAGQLMFPVRKDYFYDRLPGLLLNLTLTSGSMWPPIFRDERKTALNAIAMQQLGHAMREGAVVGIHPEGKRGQGADPYVLGQAKPGLGQLVVAAHPDTVVLPTWILGMSNSFYETVSRNFRAPGHRGEPVRIWYGAPIRAGELVAAHGDDAMAITEAVMRAVAALGEQDREERLRDPSSI